jgi:hypothetical protein
MLVGKTGVKRPLGRPRRRWEDIRLDLREIELEDDDWISVDRVREECRAVINKVMKLRVP